MKLKLLLKDFNDSQVGGYIVERGMDPEQVIYEVSDDFIRDLKWSLCGAEQDNFTTLLIRLIFKADINNKLKLAKGYPEEVLTIWAYQNVKDFHLQFYEKNN